MRALWVMIVIVLTGCQSVREGSSPAPAASATTASFTERLNAQRAAHARASLVPDVRLARAAQAHARDMVANGFFSHVGADGSSFSDRARAAGYGCAAAENIAVGQQTEQDVIDAWMSSAGHRRTILLREAVQFGLGRAGDVWVLVVGRGC